MQAVIQHVSNVYANLPTHQSSANRALVGAPHTGARPDGWAARSHTQRAPARWPPRWAPRCRCARGSSAGCARAGPPAPGAPAGPLPAAPATQHVLMGLGLDMFRNNTLAGSLSKEKQCQIRTERAQPNRCTSLTRCWTHRAHMSQVHTWCQASVQPSSAVMSFALLAQPLATASSSSRSRCSPSAPAPPRSMPASPAMLTPAARPVRAAAPDARTAALPVVVELNADSALVLAAPPEDVASAGLKPSPAALSRAAGADCAAPAGGAAEVGASMPLRSTGSGACRSSAMAFHSPAWMPHLRERSLGARFARMKLLYMCICATMIQHKPRVAQDEHIHVHILCQSWAAACMHAWRCVHGPYSKCLSAHQLDLLPRYSQAIAANEHPCYAA